MRITYVFVMHLLTTQFLTYVIFKSIISCEVVFYRVYCFTVLCLLMCVRVRVFYIFIRALLPEIKALIDQLIDRLRYVTVITAWIGKLQ